MSKASGLGVTMKDDRHAKSAKNEASNSLARGSSIADKICKINQIWDEAVEQRDALLAKEDAFWAQCEREGPPKNAAELQKRNTHLISLQMETIALQRRIAHQSRLKIRRILETPKRPDKAN